MNITDRVIGRATAGAILTAGSRLNGAASPCKAVPWILKKAATCGSRGARVILITHGWRRACRGWRGRTRVWWVPTFLCWVRCLHCNPTLAGLACQHITLQLNVPILTPAWTPWVLHQPIIFTILCSVSNHHNTVVKLCSTDASKNTLPSTNIQQN